MSPAAGSDEIVVRIRLFAILRERAGHDTLELRLRRGATVADALRALSQTDPLGELLGRMPVQMAVNRDYAAPETQLSPDDELALIPPVSGGDAGPRLHIRVSEEPLSLERLSRAVSDPGAGAIVIFQGVTREIELLEYEAYVEMAERRIEQIMRDCISAHGLRAGGAEHRVGSVALGEPSVIVAVSAAHRAEAFAAAREAIDRIKAEAPIWKREQGPRPAGARCRE
jgi:molybdopterin converting factor subunit 1